MLSLEDGLDRLLATLSDFEGEIRIDHDGVTHRLLVRANRVVAAHVAGHFDPVLGRLRKSGALDERGYHEALEAMASSNRRSGEVAKRRGVEPAALQRALAAQLVDALAVLRRNVDGTKARVSLHPRRVRATEIVSLRRIEALRDRNRRAERTLPRHRALARIARELHPDRLMHLPENERRRRERRLAHLSARLQGL